MVFEGDPARESGANLNLRNRSVLNLVEQCDKSYDFLAKDEVAHLKFKACRIFRVKPNVGSGDD